jgi:hypothetical protein
MTLLDLIDLFGIEISYRDAYSIEKIEIYEAIWSYEQKQKEIKKLVEKAKVKK